MMFEREERVLRVLINLNTHKANILRRSERVTRYERLNYRHSIIIISNSLQVLFDLIFDPSVGGHALN